MTVKREIEELDQRMMEVIKLFRSIYSMPYSEGNALLPKLEKEINYLHWDLNAVSHNLKAI